MDPQQNLPRVPGYAKFRVLIIGRANAGKTSILQRVCDTTESPEIYRRGKSGNDVLVRSRSHQRFSISSSRQVKLEPSMEVRQAYSFFVIADREADPARAAWPT
jgi:hypothetical protein